MDIATVAYWLSALLLLPWYVYVVVRFGSNAYFHSKLIFHHRLIIMSTKEID